MAIIKSKTQKYFYRRNGVATLVSGNESLSCMRFDAGLSGIRSSAGLNRIIGSDAQGSVLYEIERAVCVKRIYAVYGRAAHCPVEDIGFKGERCDVLTQCYPLGKGYRTYSPLLMRFQSTDNQSPFGKGGLNAYAFVRGDPVNLIDTSGHSPSPGQGQGLYYKGPIRMVDGMRVFYSQSDAGVRVLNIGAHGFPGRIGTEHVNHPARAIVHTLEKSGYAMSGQATHILACNSANGKPSFIQDMANITRAPSTGYQGSLWTDDNRPARVNGDIDNYWVRLIKTMTPDDSDYARFAYAPVTVEPEAATREMSNEPKDLATRVRQ